MNDRGILSAVSQILSHGSYVSHITLNFIVIVTEKKKVKACKNQLCKLKETCAKRNAKIGQ